MRRTKELLPEGATAGIVLLALLVALVIGTGIWITGVAREQFQTEILKEHSLIAQHRAESVGAVVAGRLRLVESYAGRPTIVEAAARREWSEMTSHLTQLLGSDHFSGAAFTDAAGDIRVLRAAHPALAGRVSPYRNNFYRARAEQEPYVSDAFFTGDRRASFGITFSARVEASSGRFLGVLQATSPVSRGSLLPSMGRETGGDIELFDRSGTPLLGHEDPGLGTGLGHFGVSEGLSGQRGAGYYREPGSGHEVVVGYAPVPGLQWVLLSEEPRGRASASIRPLVFRLAPAGLILLLVTGVVAWLLLRLIRRLAAERNRSQTLLVSIADGVVVTDRDGRIVLMNPAMEKMTGWPLDEARGRILQEVTGFSVGSPERTAEVVEETYASVRGGNTFSPSATDHTITSREGRTIPISWTAAPLRENEDVTGIVSVVRDVSRDREADQLKASLVSTVSHELRTPLTMIQGFAELLASRELPEPKRHEAVAQINSAAERLSQLISDLLSVSRMESGRLIVEVEQVDVSSILDHALERFSPRERSRVLVDVPAELPPLLADPEGTIQVLTNLVGNALMYSPSQAPVEVAARRKGPTIEIVVSDAGIGLDADDVSRVFDKFFRADDSDVRETPGAGLGLYIARNLVEMQGGRIWAESERGAGSRFYVSLPCAVPARREPRGAKVGAP